MINNFAVLKPESPFFALFDDGVAPIKNILLPCVGEMIGAGVHEYYWLDAARCSREQIQHIAAIVAAQCGGTIEEVEAHIHHEETIPLRALHVSCVGTNLAAFI